MSTIKTKNNNFCGNGKHYHPNHHHADSTGCMNNSDMESFRPRASTTVMNMERLDLSTNTQLGLNKSVSGNYVSMMKAYNM